MKMAFTPTNLLPETEFDKFISIAFQALYKSISKLRSIITSQHYSLKPFLFSIARSCSEDKTAGIMQIMLKT